MKRIATWLIVLVSGFSGNLLAETGQANIRLVDNDQILPGGVFNVATYDAPRAFILRETGLREAGIASGHLFQKADEIRIFSSRSAMNAAPLARVWVNEHEGKLYWFQTGGKGSAEEFAIPAGAAVVIWTKTSTAPITWTNVFR